MAARKKKKKKESLRVEVADQDFQSDPLVEGDNRNFDQERIFTSGKFTIKYTFREHFLYFPWENKKSKYYSINCPPAAYHLEKRPDLKNFNFFEFRKSKNSVNLYRFARENKLCDDLLEYISDNIEKEARRIFKQQLEELRNSRNLVQIEEKRFYEPLFPKKNPIVWQKNIVRKKPDNSNEVMEWLNNLKIDPLVQELPDDDKDIFFITKRVELNLEDDQVIKQVISSNHMINFESVEDSIIVRKFIRHLIREGFQRKATKFKFAICSPPGSGKTYLRKMFSSYAITDLDDLTFFDPINSKIFHKLINSRDWHRMRTEYHRVINSRFKNGILLCQNSDQLPDNIPFVHFLSNNFIIKKNWTSRGIFDIFKKNKHIIFIKSRELRNSLIQIVFDELYNSINYF